MTTDITAEWKKSLLCLQDQQFFDLMRLYTGEIKTPFNKQKLLEQITEFLLKPKIKKAITASLDSSDILFLTAIKILPSCTQTRLTCFFSGSINSPKVYTKLANLEERLIIYKTLADDVKDKIYKINPILYESLKPLLPDNLFSLPEDEIFSICNDEFFLSDVFYCGIYSFILHNPLILKTDGSFRKKTEESLTYIFPDLKIEDMKFIFIAFENLGLISKGETGFFIHSDKWISFSQLSIAEKAAYVCTAASCKLRSSMLQYGAQIFLDLTEKLKYGLWYKKETVKQLYFLLYKHKEDFSKYVPDEQFWSTKNGTSTINISVLENALNFNIFFSYGDMICINPALKINNQQPEPLVINPTFEATLKPDASLKDMLSVLNCFEPKSIQRIGIFEMTKKACFEYFKTGKTCKDITDCIQKITTHQIPQNIIASLDSWYQNSLEISLYNGLVMCVAENKQKIFECNTHLAGLISKQLGKGIYLLKNYNRKHIEEVIEKSGLGLTFYAEKTSSYPEISPIPKLIKKNSENTNQAFTRSYWNKIQEKREEDYLNHIKFLYAKIETSNTTKEEKQALHNRVASKIIIDEQQIRPDSIKLEIAEASCMDFSGKVRIAEQAIHSNLILEISFLKDNRIEKIICRPKSLDKNIKDYLLFVIAEDSKTEKIVSLAHIYKIKMFHPDVFS